MLSTKNINTDAKIPKTLSPGNHQAKLNRIELADGYNAGSYDVFLHLEGPDQGPDFEGFFVDIDDKTGPRYKGQVARIKMSAFAYEDGTTKSGIPVNRDQSILRGLVNLAKVLGLQDELNSIEVPTIEEFVPMASKVLGGSTFINWCIAGKEYEKGGYTNYYMFLPNSKKDNYAYEAIGVANSKLMQFDKAVHITGKAVAKPVDSFEPVGDNSFEL